MALTYVGASTIVYSINNLVTTAAANAIGDLLILAVGTKPDTTPATTPSGWTQLLGVAGGTGTTGIDTGPMRIGIFYKVATSANETAGTVTVTGNNVSTAQIFAYRAGAGNTFDIAGTAAGDTTTGTAFSAAMPVNPGMTVADELLAFGVAPTDAATYSAQTVAATGMTTVTLTEINEWVTASGQDMGGWVARGPVVTGTATAVPTVSSTAAGTTTNVAGVLALVRVREVVITAKSGSETGTFSASTESSSLNASTPTNPTFVAVTPTGAWNTTTSPKTPTALNVLANDVLVDVMAAADIWDAGGDAFNVTNSGTAQTWTKNQTVGPPLATNCFVQGTTAIQSVSDSAETITGTYTNPGGFMWGHQVFQFRDSNGIGNTVKNNVTTAGTATTSITTTQDNSAIVVIIADWNANDGATRTWATVNGITPTAANGYEKTYTFTSTQYTVYAAYYPDAGAAGAKTVGVTTPSMMYSIVAIEVKGASGAASTPVTASDAGTFSVTGVSDSTVSSALTDSGTFSATETSTSSSTLSRTDTGTFSATDTSGLVVALTANDTGTFSATETSALAITNAISTTDAGTFSAGTETSSSTSTLSRTDTGTFSATETSSLVINNGVSAVDSGTFSVSAVAALSSVGSTTDSGTLSDTETSSLLSLSTTSDNGTLSATESSSIVEVSTLLAAYGFESSGSTMLDSSGNGHTGTLTGSAAWQSPGHNSSGEIYNPSSPTDGSGMTVGRVGLEPTTAITVMGWVKLASNSGAWAVALSKSRAGTGDSYALYTHFQSIGRPAFYFNTTNGEVIVGQSATGALETGVWHHLAGTYDGVNGKFYIDGVLSNTVAGTGNLVYDSTNLSILTSLAFPNETMVGEVDDVRIYSVAKTQSEIQTLMNSPVGQAIVSASDTGTLDVTGTANVLVTLSATDTGTVSVTEAADAAPQGTTTYRIYESATPPTTAANDFAAVTLGVEFYVTSDATLTEIRWWQPDPGGPTNTSPRQGRVWRVSDVTSLGTTPSVTPSGSGWQTLTFATPVALAANTRYRVGVYHPNGGYPATGAYYSGGADETNGPLVIPKAANATGLAQGTYNYNAGIAYPGSSFNDTNYWIDVTVSTAGGTTIKSGADSGTFSATETAAVSSTITANDSGTFSATENASGTSTQATSDSGTFSATESASLVVSLSSTDTGTFSVTDISASSSTLAANETGTFSATEAINKNVTSPDSGTFSATDTSSLTVIFTRTDTGTFSATETSASSSTLAATDSGFFQASGETSGLAATSPTSDSGTFSATETAVLLITSARSDNGTFSATDTSGLTGVATVSTTDAGTFSASGEVSSLAIITAKAANDTGTFSATETSALNKNIGANDTGTFSVTEARTLAATTPSSDTGAFSATESASILVTSQASDAGTFTDTEQAGLYFDATSSSADSGTLSATENAVLAFGIFADSADSGTLSITEQATLVQGDAELVRISANDGGTLSAEEKQIEFFKQQYIEPAVLPFIERPGPKPIRQFHSRFTPKFIRLWRP